MDFMARPATSRRFKIYISHPTIHNFINFSISQSNQGTSDVRLSMCNSCNKEFEDDAEQKLHYKSEWHRYNLKRKVSDSPP